MTSSAKTSRLTPSTTPCGMFMSRLIAKKDTGNQKKTYSHQLFKSTFIALQISLRLHLASILNSLAIKRNLHIAPNLLPQPISTLQNVIFLHTYPKILNLFRNAKNLMSIPMGISHRTDSRANTTAITDWNPMIQRLYYHSFTPPILLLNCSKHNLLGFLMALLIVRLWGR